MRHKLIHSMDDLPAPTAERDTRNGRVRYRGRYYCPWADCSWREENSNCRGHKDGLSGFITAKAAKAAARKRQLEIFTLFKKSAPVTGDSRTTLGEVADAFFAQDGGNVSEAGESSLSWYRTIWESWVTPLDQRDQLPTNNLKQPNPSIAATHVGDVTQALILDWLQALRAAGLSTSSLKGHLTVIKLLMAHATVLGHIEADPISSMKPVTELAWVTAKRKARHPEKSDGDLEAFTEHQIWQIAGAIRPEYRALVLICGLGGLRFSEAIALRESDFYYVGQTLFVKVERQYSRSLGKYTTPKNDKTRQVPLFLPGLADEIRKWLMDAPKRNTETLNPDGLVFRTPTGRPIAYNNFLRRDWRDAVATCGLPDYGTHALRRTAASLMVNDYGLAITIASDILGNDPRVLDRHYRQTNKPSQLASAVSDIGRVVQGAVLDVTTGVALDNALANASAIVLTDGTWVHHPDADVIELTST